MTPDEYCQQKAAQSGSSFYYSFLFLPPARRRAITALYAFCREVDDVVDECTDASVARIKLAWWRNQVGAIYSGAAAGEVVSPKEPYPERLRDATEGEFVTAVPAPDPLVSGPEVTSPPTAPLHPVTQALKSVVETVKLPQHQLQEIIDGMEMDLTQRRYADFNVLKLYCFRVAGVVGLLSAEIFGYGDPQTLHYAQNLGMAFQLTNIIRDVGEDARRDRVYLPLDELERYNVTVADIMNARQSDAFRQLMEFQIQRAISYYQAAFESLPVADRKQQRPGLVMAAIYQTLLNEIRSDGSKVLTQRTSLTPLRKLWIAWKTWVKG